MDGKAKEFRKKADDCEALAADASDPHVKADYQELAHEWRELARQVERFSLI